MENREKNIVDKFLDNYESISNNQVRYKRIYQRPSKFKSFVGFVFSVVLLIMLLFMFVFKLLYFVIIIGVSIAVIYFGVNLFTDKGIGLPKNVPVVEEDIDR